MHLMFVCEHYLFLDAKGFPRAKLEDNYKIRGRYTVPGRGTVPYAREKTVYEQLRVFRADVYFQYSLIRLHEKRNVPRFVTKA